MRLSALAWCLASIACTAGLLSADERELPVRAEKQPGLASARDENPSPTLINRLNLREYRSLVVSELAPLVSDGLLELRAFKELRYPYQLDASWNKRPADGGAAISNDGVVSGIDAGARHFPFAVDLLMAELTDVPLASRKLLWNVSTYAQAYASSRTELVLRTVKSSEPGPDLRIAVRRAVPRRIKTDDRTTQLFRERLSFDSPRPIAGWSWLTFRFLGVDEDIVWIYSPAIKKVRQITESNRSDSFIRTAVSANDLFGWSGKNEQVIPQITGELSALVPAGDIDAPAAALRPDGCLVVSPAGEKHVAANVPAPGGSGSAVIRPVMPENLFFIPRALWRVELTQQDPFSLYGRQVLYVDKALNVPAIKIVYDRAGRLWKIVLTSFGVTGIKGTAERHVVPLASVVFDRILQEVFQVVTSSQILCDKAPDGMTLSEFDPKNLSGAPAAAAAPAAQTPAAVPAATPTVVRDPDEPED